VRGFLFGKIFVWGSLVTVQVADVYTTTDCWLHFPGCQERVFPTSIFTQNVVVYDVSAAALHGIVDIVLYKARKNHPKQAWFWTVCLLALETGVDANNINQLHQARHFQR
jgi:hypothetical protein